VTTLASGAPGRALERTALSWTRTSLALLANGLLVVVRHENALPWPVALPLSLIALAVAVLTFSHGVRRSRSMRRPASEVRVATTLVVSLGVGVTGLCVATAAALLVWE
jgi:uncharacterized membrane protein YidH (DUF202 family)